MAANDRLSLRICWKTGCEIEPRLYGGKRLMNSTSLSGSFTGIDRSITESIRLKIAVLAPMPRARDATAITVNSGLRRKSRAPWTRSRAKIFDPSQTALVAAGLLDLVGAAK